MDYTQDLTSWLSGIAESASRRAEEIRLRGERIDAARRRLWDRMDHFRRAQAEDAARFPAPAMDIAAD